MNPAILRNIKIGAMPSNAIIYGDCEVDQNTSIDDRVACIFNLFEKHGEMNYVGEDVSQLQHAQQVNYLHILQANYGLEKNSVISLAYIHICFLFPGSPAGKEGKLPVARYCWCFSP